MKMSSQEVLWMLCPLLEDLVEADKVCRHCPHWSGERCLHRNQLVKSSGLKRFGKKLRIKKPRRGGRGLRIPAVWEKWPRMSRDEGSNEIMPEEGPDYVLAGSLAECEETVQEPRQPEDAELTEYELRETGEMPGEPEIEIRSDPQNNLTGPDIEPPTAQLDSGPQMDLFPDTPGGPLDSECPLGRQEKLPGLDGPPDLLNPTDGIG